MSRPPPRTLSPERLTCWDLAANLGDIEDLLMHGSKWDEVLATATPPVQLLGLTNLCDNEVFTNLVGATLLFCRTLCEIPRLSVRDKFTFCIAALSRLSCQMESVECTIAPRWEKGRNSSQTYSTILHAFLTTAGMVDSSNLREKALFWTTVRGCGASETGRHS